jgi:hypothetical protein
MRTRFVCTRVVNSFLMKHNENNTTFHSPQSAQAAPGTDAISADTNKTNPKEEWKEQSASAPSKNGVGQKKNIPVYFSRQRDIY